MGKTKKRLTMAKYAKKYASRRATMKRLKDIAEEDKQPVVVEIAPPPPAPELKQPVAVEPAFVTTPPPAPELKVEKAAKPAPKKKPALKKKPATKSRFSKTKAKKSTSEG